MTKFCYELFAGAGGAGCGMIQAGHTSLGGVENHSPAADIYDLNHRFPLTRANILDIDRIPTVDLLWASPPCQSHSIANRNKGEKENDIALAQHIARLMIESRPKHIAIENVRAYGKSKSLAIIYEALVEAGYDITSSIECAANYGAPTTRERFIFRATLDTLEPIVQTHSNPSKQQELFGQKPHWNGWWDAIAHLVDDLDPSHITENQIKAIAHKLPNPSLEPTQVLLANDNGRGGRRYIRTGEQPAHTITTVSKNDRILISNQELASKFLVDGAGNKKDKGYTMRMGEQPSHTVTASHSKHPMRILIERVGYYNGDPGIWRAEVPSPTIRSSQHIDNRNSYRVAYNVVDGYDCYKANIQCLAAWQGFPADYNWGKNRGEAGRGIGNSVPPQLASAVAKSFG